MKVSYAKCDACGRRTGEGHRESEATFEVRTWFADRQYDVCRGCWEKMCAAVGLQSGLSPERDHERIVESIHRDPTSGMLVPETREQWRALLDGAGLPHVREPTE